MTKSTRTNKSAPAAAATVATVEAGATEVTNTVNTEATSAVAAAVKSLRGTPAELIASGVRLNGKLLDAPTITSLRKYHYGKAVNIVDHVEKPQGQKGKPAEILELSNSPGFEFGFAA